MNKQSPIKFSRNLYNLNEKKIKTAYNNNSNINNGTTIIEKNNNIPTNISDFIFLKCIGIGGFSRVYLV